MAMHKVIPIEIYNTDLLVYFGDVQGVKEALQKYIGEDKAEETMRNFGNVRKTTIARTCIAANGGVVLWMPLIPDNTKDYATLAHETLHAAAFIMRKAGIQFSADTEEAYAYLIGYITLQIEEFIAALQERDKHRINELDITI